MCAVQVETADQTAEAEQGKEREICEEFDAFLGAWTSNGADCGYNGAMHDGRKSLNASGD